MVEVNPRTAQVAIVTDPLPQIIDGVPTQIHLASATIDRPKFLFNPTDCQATATTGSVEGARPVASTTGATTTAALSDRFEVGGCHELAFKPSVSVSAAGHGTKADGTGVFFKIAYPKNSLGNEAWLGAAKLDIPKQLASRSETLQQACTARVFEANPAACPKASVIGHAIVHTQVLPVALTGPVYFVSYGSAKFPDVVMVLQGDNVTIDATGETFISHKTGITSVTFPEIPADPVESIEVSLPAGPFSEFTVNLPEKDKRNLCGHKLTMPTSLHAQNGLEKAQQTSIAITGCKQTKHKSTRTKKRKSTRTRVR
jgi:hypothetical protein